MPAGKRGDPKSCGLTLGCRRITGTGLGESHSGLASSAKRGVWANASPEARQISIVHFVWGLK